MNKLWVKVLTASASAILLIALIKIYQVQSALESTVDKINVEIPEQTAPKVELKDLKPISILLLGLDIPHHKKGTDIGRTDTMMLVTINPETKQTTIVSIPRDIRVYIEEQGFQKINAVWTFGEIAEEGSGIEASTAFISEMFDTPINYAVQLDFQGFSDLVDAIGGVTVENDFAFTSRRYEFPVGPLELDGKEALTYVRMRYEDPLGETGRQKRQRQVIRQIAHNMKSPKVLSSLRSIFRAVEDNVRTNLTLDEMIELHQDYVPMLGKIESIVVETTPATIDDISYERLHFEERVRIANILRNSLELASKETSEYTQTTEELSNPPNE